MKLFIIFRLVYLALQSKDVFFFPEGTMWSFGSSYDVFASLSFLFLGLVDMSFTSKICATSLARTNGLSGYPRLFRSTVVISYCGSTCTPRPDILTHLHLNKGTLKSCP